MNSATPVGDYKGHASVKDAITENEQIYQLITDTVAARVNHKLDERWHRFQGNFLSVISLFVGVAVVSGGFLINELMQVRIERQVTTTFQEKIQYSLDNFEFLAGVTVLNGVVSRIDQGDGFTNLEAKESISQFKSLYEKFAAAGASHGGLSKEQVLENRGKLAPAFDTLIQNFAAAGQNEFVASLSSVASEVAKESDVVTQLLVQSLGRELIGAPSGAKSWLEEGSINESVFSEYRSYSLRARETGFPELFLTYEPILRHMMGGDQEGTAELVKSIGDLSPEDSQNYLGIITALSNQSYTLRPDNQSRLVSERVNAFINEYREYSEILNQIASLLED